MLLPQPKRDNPLMKSYFGAIGLPGADLARVCDVSRPQIYMARA